MYSWDDRDGTSLTLRPELTASIARSFIQNNLKAISPLNKLYYLGPLFRRERPQKGRQRQFHQFGVEALGSEFPEMDAEIISIAWTIILKCQLSGSTSLQLNSIGSKECREGYRDALKNFVRPYLKEFSETSQKRFSENVLRLLDTKSDKEQIILNDAPKISKYYTKDDKKHFEKVKELLQTLRIPFSINSKLVRGLDYYSRTVFEFTSSSLGAQNAILGGGRYDNLIKDLGGKETPGIGFAAGMERFLIAMKDEYNNSHIDIYVACILEDGLQKSLSISNELRNLGLRVTSDTLRRSLKSQMRDANKLKSKYIIIIGEEELESETFIVKDLDKGNQKTLSKSEVIELLKNVII
ncbi:histidine--tRNA ligase, partial [Candidatus Marinimicrobia bacterium]|nr:histidine--tRNA ligase [Candidatus Neomarinimicrobiota bacterium]